MKLFLRQQDMIDIRGGGGVFLAIVTIMSL